MNQSFFVAFLALGVLTLVFSFVYYLNVSRAIKDALREHDNKNAFNLSLLFIFIIAFALIAYFLIANPTIESFLSGMFSGGSFLVVLGFIYLALEIPYLLVKIAAKDFVEEIAAAGNDKRQAARVKSAEFLAEVVKRKLKVSCELQAITHNDEYVFLTYIVNNKPVATRLKLTQADSAESWKKLSDWLITNYQAQNP